ncbi:hypothetical protein Y5W_00840 [Alcanivorax sp. 521-1]|uniref:DUF3592 domain-containing protein n=1 Tax=Alloalcanivorax profundimaris TaxID=2735259 RepID=A0ABS0AN47_9GAMM|nr:hypothetical protein [Alloalcanivorax profundimaris]MAO60087.1 hypothetical protein [Alcanivorax sp.]MBM1144076.1 hypothetical protein [Alcanivorax sp. ZXX171]MCQ6262274.1 hypothetical protein [Alcanivorax sp. MM125-6]UWN48064.1 hypothetical protein ASALC70_00242 [Alcanivorax sp. ALC70]MAY10516.1 hypothetical protein [Alcanivorax sp.]|tara:strand:+ start:20860 stop:21579 length:720 start_codon:yes stop_codon:yes gene_type:complete
MALFDLPAPLFAAVDAGLATVLPGAARLAVWAVLAGVGTLLLYRLLSPQKRIGQAKRDAREARRALNGFDGEFSEAGPLIKAQFTTAFRHLGLVLIPTLISILPLLALLTWLEGHYAHRLPAVGETPAVQAEPDRYQAQWIDGDRPRVIVRDGGGGGAVAEVAVDAPIPVVERRHWWNALIGNPLGYLPDQGGPERVTMALPQPRYLPFGPDWMRHWLMVFFPIMLIVSLLTYRWAKIE